MSKTIFLFFSMGITYPLLAQNMGIKLPQGSIPNKTLDINGSFGFREGSPLTLDNTNNNVTLPEFSYFRIIGATSAFSISGFSNGADGRMLTLINTTSHIMTILNDNNTSLVANRIKTGTGQDISINPNGSVTLQYNTHLNTWFVTGLSGGATSSDWALNGNNGTNPNSNFVGTTDNIALGIRTNNTERVRITEGGNVGIATNNPTNKLTVDGHQNISGHLAVGTHGIIDNTDLLWPTSSTKSVISAQEDMTGALTTDFQQGIASQIRLDANNRSTTEVFSLRGEVETKSANAFYYNVVGGVVGAARHRGTDTVCSLIGFMSHSDNKNTGIVKSAIGIQAIPYNSGTGRVTDAFGIWTHSIKNTSTGIVTNAFGVYIDDPSNSGTVNNNYGIYIKDQSPVGSTQSYNIYSAGASAKNYFEGRVGIGINTPNAALQLANSMANRRVVLWEDANNDHQFYGFGVNNNTLRYQINGTTSQHIFYAGNSNSTSNELMRIQADGKVGIGTPLPDQMLSVNGNASKAGGGTWATFSDLRVKRNILPFTEGVATLLKINPVQFQYNTLSSFTDTLQTHIGVIAQEIESITPYMVKKTKTQYFEDQRVFDGSALTYILINSIKEQQGDIEVLKIENGNLKKEFQELKLKYDTLENETKNMMEKMEKIYTIFSINRPNEQNK